MELSYGGKMFLSYLLLLMNSSEVDLFYRKVIKDFIANLGKNQVVVMELEQSNVYLNQIEEKMFQKIGQADLLLKRLIGSHNEIEKQMQARFSTLTSDPASTPRHPSLISQDSRSREINDYSSSNPSNDLHDFHAAHHATSPLIASTSDSRRPENKYISDSQSIRGKKRQASEYSFDDISQIDQDHNENFRRLREDSKIHILGTYDPYSKKHSFKMEKTDVTLQNVFVKVEGVSKEIFLNKVHCTSRKRLHT